MFARRMPAEAACDVVAKNRKVFSGRHGRGGFFSGADAGDFPNGAADAENPTPEALELEVPSLWRITH